MRFVEFAKSDFTTCVGDNGWNARQLLDNFSGSWEVWLQVQVALHVLRADPNAYTFERERKYPNAQQSCDFVIDPRNAGENLIWVELKVLLRSGPSVLINRFMTDIEKMIDNSANIRNSVYEHSTGGALLFAPRQARRICEKLVEKDRYELHRYYYQSWDVAVGPRGSYQQMNSSTPDYVNNDDAIAIYREIYSSIR